MRFYTAIFITLLGTQGLQARAVISENVEAISSQLASRSISSVGLVNRRALEGEKTTMSNEGISKVMKITTRDEDDKKAAKDDTEDKEKDPVKEGAKDDTEDKEKDPVKEGTKDLKGGAKDLKEGVKQVFSGVKNLSPIKVDKDVVKSGLESAKNGIDKGIDKLSK